MATPVIPNIIRGGQPMPNSAGNIFRRLLGSPALGTTTAVHAAVTDTGATQTITTGITNPDVTRNITATAGGTGANITAISVTITGIDAFGNSITETLPVFTAATPGSVVGSKAFAQVTSISQPACGTGVTISYGLGAKLGLLQHLDSDTVLNAYLNGVRETTRPTVTFDPINISGDTLTLNSALNGNPVLVDYYKVTP